MKFLEILKLKCLNSLLRKTSFFSQSDSLNEINLKALKFRHLIAGSEKLILSELIFSMTRKVFKPIYDLAQRQFPKFHGLIGRAFFSELID